MTDDIKHMENWDRFDSIGDETEGRFMRGAVTYNPAHIVRISPISRHFERDHYYMWAVFLDGCEIKIKFHKKEAAEKFHQDIVSKWYPDNRENK